MMMRVSACLFVAFLLFEGAEVAGSWAASFLSKSVLIMWVFAVLKLRDAAIGDSFKDISQEDLMCLRSLKCRMHWISSIRT